MDYQLSVDRYDLLEGLKHFKPRRKVRASARKRSATSPADVAVLGFDGRFFSIEALDQVIVAKADGVWPGLATVNSNVIVALAVAPPTGDPVSIACNGERLRIGSLTIGCTWQPVSHRLLELPASPDWVEAISIKYRLRRSQILAKGYGRVIAKAERKLAALIADTAKSLSPLGVTEKDIRLLVENRLAERYAASSKRA